MTTTKRPVRPYGGVSAQERMTERRERLLEAGLEEFGTRGFGQTGVKDICRQAGLTDVPLHTLTAEVVDAVRRGRRHVRLPRRLAPLSLLGEAPRRSVEMLLTGVRWQED